MIYKIVKNAVHIIYSSRTSARSPPLRDAGFYGHILFNIVICVYAVVVLRMIYMYKIQFVLVQNQIGTDINLVEGYFIMNVLILGTFVNMRNLADPFYGGVCFDDLRVTQIAMLHLQDLVR